MVEVDTSTGHIWVPYELRRSRRARYIRITIGKHNHALLTVPWTQSYKDAVSFLTSQGDWLVENLKANPGKASLFDYLKRNPRIYGMGKTLGLSFSVTNNRKPFIVYSYEQGEAELRIRPNEDADNEVFLLLREFAADALVKRTYALAHEQGLKVNRVSTRNQSSRWGSCSSQGNLSLNWRLILLRPHLQDHVLYHELAHITEMNHSKAFWDLLARYDPRAQQHNSQLNTAAVKLMPLGHQ